MTPTDPVPDMIAAYGADASADAARIAGPVPTAVDGTDLARLPTRLAAAVCPAPATRVEASR